MKTISLLLFSAAAAVAFASPSVSNIVLSQNDGREWTVTYDLAEAPAVITLSIETNNGSAWVPMDDKVVSRAIGDVNRKITAASGRISFVPECEIPDVLDDVRAVVTAWPMDDTPNYMVFALSEGAASADDRVRYYASTNAMPGGLLGNVEYRTGFMVFRKIRAKGVTWTMGSDHNIEPSGKGYDLKETPHDVTLDHNYYIGVFPLTRGQYRTLMGSWLTTWFTIDRAMRIQDGVNYNGVARGTNYPLDPSSSTVCGKLRERSGNTIDFDLPSEAEWEYACRAGYGHNTWPTGVEMQMTYAVRSTDPELDRIGRYKGNNATAWFTKWQDAQSYGPQQGVTNGLPIAGSFAPNAWGLYDMLGSVPELCNDWYSENTNLLAQLNGAVNVSSTDPTKMGDDTTTGEKRVRKGGTWHDNAFVCRPAYREAIALGYRGDWNDGGMRVKCYMGLR